jgi:hypothetical protein
MALQCGNVHCITTAIHFEDERQLENTQDKRNANILLIGIYHGII